MQKGGSDFVGYSFERKFLNYVTFSVSRRHKSASIIYFTELCHRQEFLCCKQILFSLCHPLSIVRLNFLNLLAQVFYSQLEISYNPFCYVCNYALMQYLFVGTQQFTHFKKPLFFLFLCWKDALACQMQRIKNLQVRGIVHHEKYRFEITISEVEKKS